MKEHRYTETVVERCKRGKKRVQNKIKLIYFLTFFFGARVFFFHLFYGKKENEKVENSKDTKIGMKANLNIFL